MKASYSIVMITLGILVVLTTLHKVHCGSFTDKLLTKLDSFGTIVAEDLSSLFNKSINSAHRIAACPFGECCNTDYIPANFSGMIILIYEVPNL